MKGSISIPCCLCSALTGGYCLPTSIAARNSACMAHALLCRAKEFDLSSMSAAFSYMGHLARSSRFLTFSLRGSEYILMVMDLNSSLRPLRLLSSYFSVYGSCPSVQSKRIGPFGFLAACLGELKPGGLLFYFWA
ncbi:uncharacterized protein [Lolium perenne]|uniref:uncharacterized protein n=1 Tax=Lolium perenne TaxID=4522 RepID=UPI003A98D6CC